MIRSIKEAHIYIECERIVDLRSYLPPFHVDALRVLFRMVGAMEGMHAPIPNSLITNSFSWFNLAQDNSAWLITRTATHHTVHLIRVLVREARI